MLKMDFNSPSAYFFPHQNLDILQLSPIVDNNINTRDIQSEKNTRKKRLPKKPKTCEDSQSVVQPFNFDDDPGIYDFKFSLINDGYKQKYYYSRQLSKLFITMGQILPIRFSWQSTQSSNYNSTPVNLWLRTKMVYIDKHHVNEPVQRCYAHMALELPRNRGLQQEQLKHVFRTRFPPSIYDPNGPSTRTSLGCIGDLSIDHQPVYGMVDFEFFCQNSCPTGMNRRPTKMVFTLENDVGMTLGKRSLQVQICSNPKRDIYREEQLLENHEPKRKMTTKPPPIPPPPNSNNNNNNDFTIDLEDKSVHSLNLEVVGEENYRAVLKYAFDVMAAQMMRTGNHEIFKPHMDEILKILHN